MYHIFLILEIAYLPCDPARFDPVFSLLTYLTKRALTCVMVCSGKGTLVPFHRAHMYFPEENPGCREVRKVPKDSGLSVFAWRETIHVC